MANSDVQLDRVVKKKTTKRKRTSKNMMTLTKRVKKLEKSVEVKALNLAGSGNVVAAGGIVSSIGGLIVQGVGVNQRIGYRLQWTQIQVSATINIQTTTLAGAGSMDIILDRHPTGTLPATSDIFSGSAPKDLINENSRKRFKVLAHEAFDYDAGSLSLLGRTFQTFRKLPYRLMIGGAAGTIADLKDGENDIIVIWRSTNSSSATTYGIAYDYRVQYTDA